MRKPRPRTRTLGLSGRKLPRLRVYTSDQAHSSAEKAAIALGLGEHNVLRVPSDDRFRMDVNSWPRDRRRSAECASANGGHRYRGTTSTASVDPVRASAGFVASTHLAAYRRRLWRRPRAPPGVRMGHGGLGRRGLVRYQSPQDALRALDFSALYVRDIARLRRVFASCRNICVVIRMGPS